MGIPALLREGISWRDVKLRAMHAAPVTLAGRPARLQRDQSRGLGLRGGAPHRGLHGRSRPPYSPWRCWWPAAAGAEWSRAVRVVAG